MLLLNSNGYVLFFVVLDVSHAPASSLFCDSQSALYIAQNSIFHERIEHIEVDGHCIRDAIKMAL